MTSHVLVADIGGTNARLQLLNTERYPYTVEQETFYPSADYDSFEPIVQLFLNTLQQPPTHACFALAGPISSDASGNQTGQVTRLPWVLDNQQLATRFGFERVTLLNDFEAIGHALPVLEENDVICLQAGEPQPHGIRAVIGAGTGLGQAMVLPGAEDIRVIPTEGGHVSFAPLNTEQEQLLHDTRRDFPHVSYDRLVSGGGITIIYRFLQSRRKAPIPAEIQTCFDQNQDPAPAISRMALAGSDKTSADALHMFIDIYGAQAGNLALNCLPGSGLYIAGGIALKIRQAFEGERFLTAFRAKGRMRTLMERFPVYLITHPQPGLLGAARMASR